MASYDRAIGIAPGYAEAWCNRGNPLRSLGRFDAAVASYDRALALRPDMAEAWSNRGSALLDLGRYQDAIVSLDRAVALTPMLAEAWFNRGIALTKIGRQHAAVESFDRALAVRPDHAETWSNRGVALLEMERPMDAIACYDRSIRLRPDLAQAWNNRGNALQAIGQFADALDAFDRAIALRPDFPDALSERIHTRYLACDWRCRAADDAALIDLVRRDLTVAPFALLPTSAAPAEQLRCARQWGARFPRAPGPLAGPQLRQSKRRRTLGYLSGDFRQHPLAHLIVDVLERHDRTQFEVVGYDLRLHNDSAIRRRLVAACDRFVDLSVLPDLAAAQAIVSDETDILVDLSGYTTRARSGVLALRPAPIQVSYLGYIGSMGADFIDYIVADPVALPMAQQQFYDEKIVHLPVSYQPNGASREISARRFTREDCGLPEQGFVFCCFNTSYKIAPDVFAIWMRLLATLPGSVLWLVGGNPLAEANLRREAAERGVAPERLVFAPKVSYPDYLARCAIGDLFLDTLPVQRRRHRQRHALGRAAAGDPRRVRFRRANGGQRADCLWPARTDQRDRDGISGVGVAAGDRAIGTGEDPRGVARRRACLAAVRRGSLHPASGGRLCRDVATPLRGTGAGEFRGWRLSQGALPPGPPAKAEPLQSIT